MKKMLVALIVSALASPAIASDKSDVLSVVNQWVRSFNQGDMKAVLESCADQTAIIDAFPPYEWQGPTACTKWRGDYEADAKAHKITNAVVTLSEPLHVLIDDGHAYVIFPAKFDFKKNGKSNAMDGLIFTVTLKKESPGWRTTGWAWTEQK